ncbi:hypothetical protein [Nocardioides aquiterrae]|uniref:Peptidase A2 domain-containing protein n=1 Tax=Nocardioides aquiterrae TaxID=203799 RepID=A0ABP4F412_9ACTN
MTVVVGVQTTDGLVFASDSATTQQLMTVGGDLRTTAIWNSANKIFNLRRTWPVGAMTFGNASVGGLSIATLAKDLRLQFEGKIPTPLVSALDPATYTVQEVASGLQVFFRDRYDASAATGDLGFIVGGFSSGSDHPEMWQVMILDTGADVVQEVLPPSETGIVHQGMTDAITRLMDGASQDLGAALEKHGVPAGSGEGIAEMLRGELSMTWAWPGMPLGETIDMAKFLVDTQINFIRFMPGDAIVGGPVEIAALTKHEGFKWVRRKHYFSHKLNPNEDVIA